MLKIPKKALPLQTIQQKTPDIAPLEPLAKYFEGCWADRQTTTSTTPTESIGN